MARRKMEERRAVRPEEALTANPEMVVLGRESRGLTARELARRMSVTPGLISQIESGISRSCAAYWRIPKHSSSSSSLCEGWARACCSIDGGNASRVGCSGRSMHGPTFS